jgi:hypothetical protein
MFAYFPDCLLLLFGSAVDVGFVLKPLAVTHPGTETQNELTTIERGIIAQELADDSQRRASVARLSTGLVLPVRS